MGLQDRGQRWFPEADPPSQSPGSPSPRPDRPPPRSVPPSPPRRAPPGPGAHSPRRGTRSRSLRESGECGRAARRQGCQQGARTAAPAPGNGNARPPGPRPRPGPPRPRPPCACVGRGQAAGGAGAAAAAAVAPRWGPLPEAGRAWGADRDSLASAAAEPGAPARCSGAAARGCLCRDSRSLRQGHFDLGIDQA